MEIQPQKKGDLKHAKEDDLMCQREFQSAKNIKKWDSTEKLGIESLEI